MTKKFLAVVNPAAGNGRCGKMVGPALERLRAAGVEMDVVETSVRATRWSSPGRLT